MAALTRFIMDTAHVALAALNLVDGAKVAGQFHSPSPLDVLEVKNTLLESSSLPLELIDIIVDYAEYWPFTSTSIACDTYARGDGGLSEDVFVLRSLPLGYMLGDADDGSPSFPLSYHTWQNVPHSIEASEAAQAMTSGILTQWKALSLPRGDHPCRKVVFTIKSRDQGWTSNRRHLNGTYKESYTWFDVGLERVLAIDKSICTPEIQIPRGFLGQIALESGRGSSKTPTSIHCDLQTLQPRIIGKPPKEEYESPFLPLDTRLQSNQRAAQALKEHIIVWSYDDHIDPLSSGGDRLEEEGRGRQTGTGKFVQNLRVGDIITVWARARFREWISEVQEMKIDVYWAV